MANINQLPLDVLLEIARQLPAEDLIPMLTVSVLARHVAALQLNVTTPIVINGTQNLVIFAQAVQANIVNIQTIRSLEIVSIRPVNPGLITPIFFRLMTQLTALESVHLARIDLVQLFPEAAIAIPAAVINLRRLTMETQGTDPQTRIWFMALCNFYCLSLQELHIQGLTNVVYASQLYFLNDLPTRLIIDYQQITRLTLHFNMRSTLTLQEIMEALPNLRILDLHNTSHGRQRVVFNSNLNSPDGVGFPLQELRIFIGDLTPDFFNSIQRELRRLESITIHGAVRDSTFQRAARFIVGLRMTLLLNVDLDPMAGNELLRYLVFSGNLHRLTFEDNQSVDFHLVHLHQTFPNVTHLRLHSCNLNHFGLNTLDTSGWDLQLFQLDITNMRGQTFAIQVNTATPQTANFQFNGVEYIRVGLNEAFVPQLVIVARELQHLHIYTAGLNQLFIIDNP